MRPVSVPALELGGHRLQSVETGEQLVQSSHAFGQFVDVGETLCHLLMLTRRIGRHLLNLGRGLFALGRELVDRAQGFLGDLANPGNGTHGFLNAGRRGIGLIFCRLGELAYFVGDNGKATTGFTRAGGFDGRIEGEQIGLIGNGNNAAGDRTDGVGKALQIIQPGPQTGLGILRGFGRYTDIGHQRHGLRKRFGLLAEAGCQRR